MCFTNPDKPKSTCGVVAVYGNADAATLSYLGLYALQHRGQESCGIVSNDGHRMHKHLGLGLVADVFRDNRILDKLHGQMAIGHNRYSTTGATHFINTQPLVVNSKGGPFAIAHNGNLVNFQKVRAELEDQGSIFQTTSDTEVVTHLIARSKKSNMIDQIRDALDQVKGAYSMVIMTQDKIFAARDPRGFRPLALGKKDNTYFIASETCAHDLVNADYLRDIEPGEIIQIDETGLQSYRLTEKTERCACIFEFIYFSRPDSKIFGENVDKARRKLGKNLALEHPADADIVISVPDSSNTAAIGYSSRSHLKLEIGLIRNHYIGRTFIYPDQNGRDFNVRVKFNTVKGVLKGRRVVVVEDSIVRATTLRQLVSLIRKAEAAEVHVRVSSPPIISPCYFGMDFPTKRELIAASKSIPEICEVIGADSLAYISKEAMLKSVPFDRGGYCTACFDAEYPMEIEEHFHKLQHENVINEIPMSL